MEKEAMALQNQFPNQFQFIKQQLPRETVAAFWWETFAFLSVPVYDGYSASVAEGRYVGAIPMVNAIPGNLEVIRHEWNGLVINPLSAVSISQTLERIEQEPEMATVFASRNQSWIRQHSMLKDSARQFLDWAAMNF